MACNYSEVVVLAKQINFIRQQGFESPSAQTCPVQYRALQVQPRIVGVIVLVGMVFRSPLVFLALSAVLAWSALFPALSPFDAVYNHLIAARRGLAPLEPAPPPRRFAQALAAILTMVIAVSLVTGHPIVAGAVEGFMLAAVGAILFGGFCLGSFVFHLLAGNGEFARRTLPWHRGP